MAHSGFQLEGASSELLSRFVESSRDGVLLVGADQCCRYANPAACEIIGMAQTDLLGQDVLALFAPEERPLLATNLSADTASAIQRRSALLHRPDGEVRQIEYATLHTHTAGQPLTLLNFRDVTDTRRVVRWAATLAQIASSVALAHPLESTLDALARNVVNSTDTVSCMIGIVDNSLDVIRIVGTYGLPEVFAERLEACWRAGADSPSRQALRERRTVVVPDIRSFILDQAAFAPLHDLVRTATWSVAVSVPLIYRQRTLGVLTCSYPQSRAPSESEVAFLSTIADQAAIAVENARLFVEAQDKAVLEERQRLARELHDSVSQALYGIALGARTARSLLDRDPSRLAEPLDYVLSLAEKGLSEMRALIFELRPESLQIEGLVVALEKQAAAMHARHNVAVDLNLCSEPELSLAIKEAFYRIAQEALHNIVKHARASQVALRLSSENDTVTLEVRDNGVGFDSHASFPGHLGLQSMRERTLRLGGTFICESAPGQGTRIYARMPIPRRPI